MAKTTVRRGGFGSLNMREIVVTRGIRAGAVDWKGLYPCCVELAGRILVRKGRMRRYRIILVGNKRKQDSMTCCRLDSCLVSGWRR